MKETNKITKDIIIREVAEKSGDTITNVKKVYDALEDVIFEHLKETDEGNEVTMKLFEGMRLDGTFIPERTMVNNLTGKESHVDSKIKPKFTFTRAYCEKLNK